MRALLARGDTRPSRLWRHGLAVHARPPIPSFSSVRHALLCSCTARRAPRPGFAAPPTTRPLSAAPLPLAIADPESASWVRTHVTAPAPSTRAQVWRVLKRRLYHYDAGVVAYRNFPRNFLLSTDQWEQLLADRPHREGRLPLALDIGAGDGSLNDPFRHLFSSIVATELSVPLVCRLRAQGLDARLAEEPEPALLGGSAFDVVFILNVLDRCKDPEKMLKQAAALLPADGLLVVSVVTPPSQSDAVIRSGSTQRRWNVRGHDFESSAASLVDQLFVPQVTPTGAGCLGLAEWLLSGGGLTREWWRE